MEDAGVLRDSRVLSQRLRIKILFLIGFCLRIFSESVPVTMLSLEVDIYDPLNVTH